MKSGGRRRIGGKSTTNDLHQPLASIQRSEPQITANIQLLFAITDLPSRNVFHALDSVTFRARPWSIQLPLDNHRFVSSYDPFVLVAFVAESIGLRPLAIRSCPARSFVIFMSS